MNIKEVIYKTLEQENKSWTPKNHNPSSASFKCSDGKVIGKDLLSLFYKWKGLPATDPPDAKAILKMKAGDANHEMIAKILAKAGIKALAEVGGKVNVPGLKQAIGYRVDGLQELNGDLLEVKSVGGDQIAGRGWGIRDCGPKLDHLLQCVCYIELVPGVKRVRLLYISRDDGEMEEFVLEHSGAKYQIEQLLNGKIIYPEITFAGICDRWAQLEGYLASDVEPLPEFRIWVNENGSLMKVKQIKGERYKSDFEAIYSSYFTKIYLDPNNFDKVTYNALFKKQGKL